MERYIAFNKSYLKKIINLYCKSFQVAFVLINKNARYYYFLIIVSILLISKEVSSGGSQLNLPIIRKLLIMHDNIFNLWNRCVINNSFNNLGSRSQTIIQIDFFKMCCNVSKVYTFFFRAGKLTKHILLLIQQTNGCILLIFQPWRRKCGLSKRWNTM